MMPTINNFTILQILNPTSFLHIAWLGDVLGEGNRHEARIVGGEGYC